ncbi:MAG TPA: FAD-binding oxidoreductase [Jatrophihabitantaceae bacterium]|jgi:sarcosine oxidase subunit beta
MVSCGVVVIGGGCVGASVAYHLAEAGCTDVVLLEANTLASGSTSKTAGGIRMQHGDSLNTQLALRSLAEFTRFEEMTGAEISFHQVGYLFLLDSQPDLDLFRAAAQMQRSFGIPVELLPPQAALEFVPQLNIAGLVGATFCPLDGYATPESVVQGYASAARRRGVTIRQRERVTRIRTEAGRVTGVDVGDEHISTSAVVCAAGVGSGVVAATAGVELPVSSERRRIFFSRHNGGVPDGIPLTVDFSTGLYFHREGPGLVFAGREFEPEDLMEPAMRRLPVLGELPISSSWHGDYDMSPDHNGMIGESDELTGFYYATGFSGHGFQLSPAVGEHVGELVTGRPPTIDLTGLRAERFAPSGARRVEKIVI